MFGSAHGTTSPAKDSSDTTLSHSPPKPSAAQGAAASDRIPRNSHDEETERTREASNASSLSPPGRKSSDENNSGGEKKRRSSGIAKAGALLSNARNSLHLPGSSSNSVLPSDSQAAAQVSAIQKLGKTDPALSVPQGSLNNSAGESRPGPRSTFRVGVTEDRNRKCRRTMEDTHAYLYNFLSTPAPSLGSDTESISSRKSQTSKEAPEPSFSVIQSSHMVETDNGYFAIFDGHAGTFAADWCGKKLHILLEEMIRKYPNTPIPELLDQTFTSVDQQLEELPVKNSGCTAITAVLRWEDRIPSTSSATGSAAIAPAAAAAAKAALETAGGAKASDPSSSIPNSNATFSGPASVIPKLQDVASRQRVLYTANVGDARIVLCRNGKALRLSYDHKGSDENEGKRISNAGGLILNNRVNGVLAVTRALGDAYMKDLVTGHPYTTETVIQPDIDEFLILACDGVSISDSLRANSIMFNKVSMADPICSALGRLQ